jgi:serine/threonine protein kinase
MGTVYRAVDQMLDREVAIKVLRPELTRQSSLNERFRSEAIAMARVSHPNIATLHGLERHGEDLYMIMEYVRGETLEHVVQRSGRLDWRRAAEILTSVLEALDHAHDMGVVHRDIKPANIMLTRAGAVKVMDFGIARMVGRSRQTQFGHAVGTPMYMAPEQLRGEDVDGRRDLYAVGAMLFELVTGRMAFEADSDYKLMMMQLNDPPPSPSSIEGDVPASVDRIVLRAMEKKAEGRFVSASAFRAALQDALRDAPSAKVSDPSRAAAVPATRFAAPAAAPHPAPIAASRSDEAATRLPLPSVPAGRGNTQPMAAIEESRIPARGSSSSALDKLSPNAQERLRDWRTWAIAASLFVAAGMLALATKPTSGAGGNSVADTSARVPPNVTTSQVAAIPSPPSTDTASAGAFPPQKDSQRTVDPPGKIETIPPQVTPVDPEPRQPRANLRRNRNVAGGAGASAAGSAKDLRRTPVPVDSTPVRTAPPVEPPKEVKVDPPVTEPEESAETSRGRIAEAIHFFTNAVNSGAAADVDRLLRGPDAPRARFVELVREGRLTMTAVPDGAPDARGGEANVPFEARVTWRTPFGSVRRGAMSMQADLSRSGRAWRLTSVRILRPIDLK